MARIAETRRFGNRGAALSHVLRGTLIPGMGTTNRAVAALACVALASGCFGYNRSAKRWAYVGDTILLVGGAAVIALDVTTGGDDCMDTPGRPCPYDAPVSGTLVAGAVLVAAGVFGIVFNATRPTVKSSR